jgi:outer membrane lipase/esterase
MLFKEHLGRLAMRAVAGLATVGALASCGGGTYQVHAFVPARIIVFGDESNSLVTSQGLKYSINGLSLSTDQLDCTVNPLWDQVLGNAYNISYANCNSQEVASPQGFDRSTLNATVADVANQVAAFQAGDSFNGNDLVTVWVGANDVLADYKTNGSGDDVNSLVNDMRGNAQTLAGVINSIVAAGAKVIVLTIPDMGLSPFAATENQRGDFDRASLLSQMSQGFNNSLRSNIVNDGSKIGLVLVDDIVKGAVRNPGGAGLIASPNATYGCIDLAPLPTCTNDTLKTDPAKNSDAQSIYLWADATHLAPYAHLQIGNQAVARAHSNPF